MYNNLLYYTLQYDSKNKIVFTQYCAIYTVRETNREDF